VGASDPSWWLAVHVSDNDFLSPFFYSPPFLVAAMLPHRRLSFSYSHEYVMLDSVQFFIELPVIIKKK
jgi:hypothetical protein